MYQPNILDKVLNNVYRISYEKDNPDYLQIISSRELKENQNIKKLK